MAIVAEDDIVSWSNRNVISLYAMPITSTGADSCLYVEEPLEINLDFQGLVNSLSRNLESVKNNKKEK